MSNQLVAFIDESGNTGNNVFDENQPYFWYGGLLIPPSYEKHLIEIFSDICANNGYRELKGSRIGLSGIDRIASNLTQFIDDADARFAFVAIEKKYLVHLSLAVIVIHSWLEETDISIRYAALDARLCLTSLLSASFTSELESKLWNQSHPPNIESFASVLRTLQRNLKVKIGESGGKELLEQCLLWALSDPAGLHKKYCESDYLPNTIGFSVLLQNMHELAANNNKKLTQITHDTQKEFKDILKQTFSDKRYYYIRTEMDATPYDVIPVDTFDNCKFQFKASIDSYGIQLIDVILWFVSKIASDGNMLDRRPNYRLLADCIKENMEFCCMENHGNVAELLQERRSGNPVVNELLGPYPEKPSPS